MLTKTLNIILSTVILLKIIVWLITNYPISWVSVLILVVVGAVINIRNKFTWICGLLFYTVALTSIFFNFEADPSDSWTHNPFLFLQSIEHAFHAKPLKIVMKILPVFFYLLLFVVFLLPDFRKRYLIEE